MFRVIYLYYNIQITKYPSGFRVDTRSQKGGGQTRLPHKGFSFLFKKNAIITSILIFCYRGDVNEEASFCGVLLTNAWPSCGL